MQTSRNLFGPIRLHCWICLNALQQRQYASEASAVAHRITLPHKFNLKLQKASAKEAARRHQERRRYKGPVVISCKRKNFNHFKGQTYQDFNYKHLASSGWKHYKSAGDYFTLSAFRSNPALEQSTNYDGDHDKPKYVGNFADFSLNAELVEGLQQLGINRPTNIQALAIPPLLQGKNVLCAAETGSGKTLAFLLPALEKMHRHKGIYGPTVTPNQPHCIILTPSRELADQTYQVACDLAQFTTFHPQVMCGGRGTQHIIRNRPSQLVDVVIASPGIFSKLLTNRLYDLSCLQYVVLDEADTLLDDSFSHLTIRILNKLKIVTEKLEVPGKAPERDSVEVVGTQLVLVSATLPRSLEDILGEIVPVETIEKVTTTHLHHLMPHVPQKFLRIKSSDKPEALLKLVKSNFRRSLPTLVFCNKSGTAKFLTAFLQENGQQPISLHGDIPQKVRPGLFDKFQNGESDVLVATDIASRGLDTVRVKHVINYDFPDFMSDYIHRVGRVGRVGSHGASFVVSFVSQKWEVDLLWKIESAARRMTELHNVNANIKRKLVSRAERKNLAAQGIADL